VARDLSGVDNAFNSETLSASGGLFDERFFPLRQNLKVGFYLFLVNSC